MVCALTSCRLSAPKGFKPRPPTLPKRYRIVVHTFITAVKGNWARKTFNEVMQLFKLFGLGPVCGWRAAESLVRMLSGYVEQELEMCPFGCMLFSCPQHNDKQYCTQKRRVPNPEGNGTVEVDCNADRYIFSNDGTRRPAGVYYFHSPVAAINAMMASPKHSRWVREWNATARKSQNRNASSLATDINKGNIMKALHKLRPNEDPLMLPLTVPLAYTSDGAELVKERDATSTQNGYVQALSFYHVPLDKRHSMDYTWCLGVSGPGVAKDTESFWYPVERCLAKLEKLTARWTAGELEPNYQLADTGCQLADEAANSQLSPAQLGLVAKTTNAVTLLARVDTVEQVNIANASGAMGKSPCLSCTFHSWMPPGRNQQYRPYALAPSVAATQGRLDLDLECNHEIGRVFAVLQKRKWSVLVDEVRRFSTLNGTALANATRDAGFKGMPGFANLRSRQLLYTDFQPLDMMHLLDQNVMKKLVKGLMGQLAKTSSSFRPLTPDHLEAVEEIHRRTRPLTPIEIANSCRSLPQKWGSFYAWEMKVTISSGLLYYAIENMACPPRPDSSAQTALNTEEVDIDGDAAMDGNVDPMDQLDDTQVGGVAGPSNPSANWRLPSANWQDQPANWHPAPTSAVTQSLPATNNDDNSPDCDWDGTKFLLILAMKLRVAVQCRVIDKDDEGADWQAVDFTTCRPSGEWVVKAAEIDSLAKRFVHEYERILCGRDHSCANEIITASLHRLLHIGDFCRTHGPLVNTSQNALETFIGSIKRASKNQKNKSQNFSLTGARKAMMFLMNIQFELEELPPLSGEDVIGLVVECGHPRGGNSLRLLDRTQHAGIHVPQELHACWVAWAGGRGWSLELESDITWERWRRCALSNNEVIRGRWTEGVPELPLGWKDDAGAPSAHVRKKDVANRSARFVKVSNNMVDLHQLFKSNKTVHEQLMLGPYDASATERVAEVHDFFNLESAIGDQAHVALVSVFPICEKRMGIIERFDRRAEREEMLVDPEQFRCLVRLMPLCPVEVGETGVMEEWVAVESKRSGVCTVWPPDWF